MSVSSELESLITRSHVELKVLSLEEIASIIDKGKSPESLSVEELADFVILANAAYRLGSPIISDTTYDQVYLADLAKRDPKHPFLLDVEAEPISGKTVPLPQRMLSTRKIYDRKDVEKWFQSIQSQIEDPLGKASDLIYEITPKLDGFAVYDDGEMLYTRGDGRSGTDVTYLLQRGLHVQGKRGLGPGEIVVDAAYFDTYLSEQFKSSRNFQSAVFATKKQDPLVQKAIDDGAVIFIPFEQLEKWVGLDLEILSKFDELMPSIMESVPYDVDGVVISLADKRLREAIGSARAHHKWQIAFKQNLDGVKTKVLDVVAQTSRTGRVNPVVLVEPIWLSGATISRASAHHFRFVEENGIGPGAEVELVRSGLVIPKIQRITKQVSPRIPDRCPSCDGSIVWRKDHLWCTNLIDCPAQSERSVEHFFKTLGNVDGFGPETVTKLYKNDVYSVIQVYRLLQEDLIEFGFGEKTSKNLISELQKSRQLQIEDWRFLAAFGIDSLGPGNAEKLLTVYSIEELLNVSAEVIAALDGFALQSAGVIAAGIERANPSIKEMLKLGFNLQPSKPNESVDATELPLSGLTLVFTGEISKGTRDELEKQAKKLGAKVTKAISKKTDFLVTGDRPSGSKVSAATKSEIPMLTESEYFEKFDLSG